MQGLVIILRRRRIGRVKQRARKHGWKCRREAGEGKLREGGNDEWWNEGHGGSVRHLPAHRVWDYSGDRPRGARRAHVFAVVGNRDGAQNKGAVVLDAAVWVLHGLEHRGERRRERHGHVGGIRCAHAAAGGDDGRSVGILRGIHGGIPCQPYDAIGNLNGRCVHGEGFVAVLWNALVTRSGRHLVAGGHTLDGTLLRGLWDTLTDDEDATLNI